MLSIGKLAPGASAYYLGAVASGVEDYYLGGEVPGMWRGSGPASLRLAGEVGDDDLTSVLAGRAPDGAALVRARRNSTPGFDLTFSAPKSVSLLYGLGGKEAEAAALAAHEAGVEAALTYLERHATFTRRLSEGRPTHVGGEGLVVAAFRHRSSRAGDPQLHSHCLVANAVLGIDGRWGRLDSRAVYSSARTAGFVYQAVLRGELSARLAVAWTPVRNGLAEVAGIDPAALRAFSRRRVEIEVALADRDACSPAAAQAATLATRRAKDYGVDGPTLVERWRARAREVGWDPRSLRQALGVATPELNRAAAVQASERLASSRGMTARHSTFDRSAVVRALCEVLPAGAPITVRDLEGLSADFLTRRDVVPLLPAPQDGRDARRFSTVELLATEAHLTERAQARRSEGCAVAPAETVSGVLADETLSDEQKALVRRLTTSGDGVEVTVGKAGSGKTTALAAAQRAWSSSGIRVLGIALAARTAAGLEATTGIRSTTLARLLAELERPGGTLPPSSVVVVDEAGMVDTRSLARVLDAAAAAGSKAVLVGDHRQLPEIEVGGAFAALVTRLEGAELRENRRQAAAWERTALDELRSGTVGDAVACYGAAGHVVTAVRGVVLRERMVTDWLAARSRGESAVLLALDNRDVADLNDRARARLVAAGAVQRGGVSAAGRTFGRDDEVVCLRNDHRLGVLNGTAGIVERISDGGLMVRTEQGLRLLPSGYLAAGHLAHGYALTVHKAQGATFDRAFVLAGDRLSREAGYVALSRGRLGNHLYVVEPEGIDVELRGAAVEGKLVRALGRSEAKRLAIDAGRPVSAASPPGVVGSTSAATPSSNAPMAALEALRASVAGASSSRPGAALERHRDDLLTNGAPSSLADRVRVRRELRRSIERARHRRGIDRGRASSI